MTSTATRTPNYGIRVVTATHRVGQAKKWLMLRYVPRKPKPPTHVDTTKGTGR